MNSISSPKFKNKSQEIKKILYQINTLHIQNENRNLKCEYYIH
jgi:hypothetical protein